MGNDVPTQERTSGSFAPGMTKKLSPCASVQASVTCAGEALYLFPICSISATVFRIVGKFSGEYLGTMLIQSYNERIWGITSVFHADNRSARIAPETSVQHEL